MQQTLGQNKCYIIKCSNSLRNRHIYFIFTSNNVVKFGTANIWSYDSSWTLKCLSLQKNKNISFLFLINKMYYNFVHIIKFRWKSTWRVFCWIKPKNIHEFTGKEIIEFHFRRFKVLLLSYPNQVYPICIKTCRAINSCTLYRLIVVFFSLKYYVLKNSVCTISLSGIQRIRNGIAWLQTKNMCFRPRWTQLACKWAFHLHLTNYWKLHKHAISRRKAMNGTLNHWLCDPTFEPKWGINLGFLTLLIIPRRQVVSTWDEMFDSFVVNIGLQ